MTSTEDGPRGRVRLTLRADAPSAPIREVLLDPERFVTAPTKPSQVRKLEKRRAVYSFSAEVDGHPVRLYLKLYRPASPKEWLEEVLRGRRAVVSLEAALEAERRGITVAHHYGASAPVDSRFRARTSHLLMRGLSPNADVKTVLAGVEESSPTARREFLRALGRFVGDAHARGLVHADLKIGNIFVTDLSPPRFALIDLDRSVFPRANGLRAFIGQRFDIRRLLRSLDDGEGRTTATERKLVLAAWLHARALSRPRRRRFLRSLPRSDF